MRLHLHKACSILAAKFIMRSSLWEIALVLALILPLSVPANASDAKNALDALEELQRVGQLQPKQRSEQEMAQAIRLFEESLPEVLELLSTGEDAIVRKVLRAVSGGGSILIGPNNQVLKKLEPEIVRILGDSSFNIYTRLAAQAVLMEVQNLDSTTIERLAIIVSDPESSNLQIYPLLAKNFFLSPVAKKAFMLTVQSKNEEMRKEALRSLAWLPKTNREINEALVQLLSCVSDAEIFHIMLFFEHHAETVSNDENLILAMETLLNSQASNEDTLSVTVGVAATIVRIKRQPELEKIIQNIAESEIYPVKARRAAVRCMLASPERYERFPEIISKLVASENSELANDAENAAKKAGLALKANP